MKRIPHVDESKVAEILNNPADKSLLETFYKRTRTMEKDHILYLAMNDSKKSL